MHCTRIGDGPIIDPATDASIGDNIQGPSAIRVPDWVDEPLGRYYLYFADHKGRHIRLAFADAVAGPWTVHEPGALDLADSHFLTEPPALSDELRDRYVSGYRKALGDERMPPDVIADLVTPHIASPDVHVDADTQTIRMYFHGLEDVAHQVTRVATSRDGLNFTARAEVLGSSYFRVFARDGTFYALVMPGKIMRSNDGFTNFVEGPTLFEPNMRHSAVLVEDDTLHVLWSRVTDCPESILYSTIDLNDDWMSWTESTSTILLQPQRAWEGADFPVEPSRRGVAPGPCNQLRDPAILVDEGATYVFYAVAGESGIAVAALQR